MMISHRPPARLTPGKARGIHAAVMRVILSAIVICLGTGRLAAQVQAPPEVTTSAVAAVQDLGKQIELGRHQVAIDRMYPHWKEIQAQQEGGMEKLQQQVTQMTKMMAEKGITVKSYRADEKRKPTAYEVWPGKETVDENGKKVEKVVFRKWLLIIPTVAEYRVMLPGERGAAPRMETIITEGFQVAISDKGKNNWTFIDGSGARVSDLRRLFITLPDNMTLPQIERRAGKAN